MLINQNLADFFSVPFLWFLIIAGFVVLLINKVFDFPIKKWWFYVICFETMGISLWMPLIYNADKNRFLFLKISVINQRYPRSFLIFHKNHRKTKIYQ